MTASRPRHTRLPLLYFGLAHVALASAFAAMAFEPARFAGFFYHPRMDAPHETCRSMEGYVPWLP